MPPPSRRTTPAHAAGAVDVVVTTPGGSGTGTGLFTYVFSTTSTTLTSSLNPSEVGQAVTFTATVSAGGPTPTGTVTFTEGGQVLGSATLVSGVASFTTAALPRGSHSITAVYAGNGSFASSTSAVLVQAVNIPTDSVRLRAMQIVGSRAVAQVSGATITNAIDLAINEGFSERGTLLMPSSGGLRFNFAADPEQQPDTSAEAPVSERWHSLGVGRSRPSERSGGASSRINDAFAAIDIVKAQKAPPAARLIEQKDWLAWADIKGSGIGQWSGSNTAAPLYGHQLNFMAGVTRKLSPTFLVGMVGGYETFDYKSDTLSSRLKGDGWTIGSYLGWRFAQNLRLDTAVAYTGLGYDSSSGAALGQFNGHRWLLSGGLIGSSTLYGVAIEPSAKVYALWERQNAYIDTLGTAQTARDFFNGRASGGLRMTYPWQLDDGITLAPYVGAFGDYYFTGDSAESLTLPGATLASVPLLEGWSARFTAGLAARSRQRRRGGIRRGAGRHRQQCADLDVAGPHIRAVLIWDNCEARRAKRGPLTAEKCGISCDERACLSPNPIESGIRALMPPRIA
ncbi:MAG: Ig-like domain repeat protein [Rhodopseudomonas palustris]|nr:Ig-like domain repeat protein [Rhodopseudomonas palustris]